MPGSLLVMYVVQYTSHPPISLCFSSQLLADGSSGAEIIICLGLKPSFVPSSDQLGIYAALFVCCTIVLLVLGEVH